MRIYSLYAASLFPFCAASAGISMGQQKHTNNNVYKHVNNLNRKNKHQGGPFSVVGIDKTATSKNERECEHVAALPSLLIRGGGVENICAASDTDAMILLKLFVMAGLETLGLLGVIAGGKILSEAKWCTEQIPIFYELPLLQWISLLVVIFNSSFVSAFIDGGMSAATNQVIQPNVVPGDPGWYANLRKPKWNPPGWLFPIMWLIVSKPTQLMAVRKLLVSTEITPWSILAVYCGHLALGDSWNKIFFGCQRIRLGATVISIFYGALILSAYLFRTMDVTAGNLMLPTCAWVTVATCLNWSILLLNKDLP